MSRRKVTRDSLGRVVTFSSVSGGAPLVHVLKYESLTRKPSLIVLSDSRQLQRQPDGTYLITGLGAHSPRPSTGTDLRLNQRTGRLTWTDSLDGQRVIDLASERNEQQKAYEAVLIFACLLFPPAWPLLLLLLANMLFAEAGERLCRAWERLLDSLYGAYDAD